MKPHDARLELSSKMDGRSVEIICTIVQYGCYYFDGRSRQSWVNPETKLYAPIKIYAENVSPDFSAKITPEWTTLIKPYLVDGNPTNIEHMWVLEYLHFPINVTIRLLGHIYSYTKGECYDYGIQPYAYSIIAV